MKPSELSTLLGSAIAARQPVLITGAPGIGKSDIVAKAATAVGAELILSHPAVSDPTDVKGLPWVGKDEQSAHFLPFGELARAINATAPTVWFLDDLGQATPAVQASFMQLLLARRVNGHKLPDCVTFIAATNRRTDKAGVSGILEPVKSRFTAIVELEADLDEWCQWAFTQSHIPAELIAFLRFRPELLSQFKASADLTNSPTPRTWSNAARVLGMNLPAAVEQAALAGAVGDGAAVELRGFLQLFKELPSIDMVLLNPDVAPIPEKPAALYAITTALATKATPTNFGRVALYAQRLIDAQHGEFAALLARDASRRNPAITQTADFIKLSSGELGQLLSGETK
jgi:hypothetical protein